MFWKKKKNPLHINSESQPLKENLPVQVVVKTDMGNIRTNNEDSILYKKVEGTGKQNGIMMLVADGMGGHLAGEVASKMAAEIISDNYFHQPKGSSVPEILSNAFVLANKKIFQSASSNSQQKGMGTTCTVLVLETGCLYFAHAGDSRAYHYGNNGITQITTDHTYVQELINEGSISKEEAEKHPQRNILTNAMGTKPDLKVDSGCFSCNLNIGEKLLLCSDGLYDYFNDKELTEILASENINQIANYLVNEAKRRGGHDNISLILARLGDAATPVENEKATREAGILKETRDAEIPDNHNRS